MTEGGPFGKMGVGRYRALRRFPRHPHTAIGRPQGIAPTWHRSGWGMGTEGCAVSASPAHRHRATTRDRPYMAPVGVGYGNRGLRRIRATRTPPSGDHKGSPLHGTGRGGASEPRAAPYPRHPHTAIGRPQGIAPTWHPSAWASGVHTSDTGRPRQAGISTLSVVRGLCQASTSLNLSCRGRPHSLAHSRAQRPRWRKSVVGRTTRLLLEGRYVCPFQLRAPDPGPRFGRHS